MKWSRAVHHLEELAHACAEIAGLPETIFPLRVTQLWAYGDVLTSNGSDLDSLQVALGVDLPVDDVAWFCPPPGSKHWSQATRLSKNPIVSMWRSTRAPVWNHHIRRPLAIWDERGGIATGAFSALRNGKADALRLPEPAQHEMCTRLEAELAVSLRALDSAAAAYEERRFRPGKIQPVADALWNARGLPRRHGCDTASG